ncbi:hypothetical protein COE51_18620 [Bacillus pseudomycoides]|nr:hypothetical protein COE51_18620 [Bacillus pseudomycoides]
MTLEFAQLAVSPLFIVVVLLALFYFIFNRKDKGFFTKFFLICSLIYICIYLLAFYFYFFAN